LFHKVELIGIASSEAPRTTRETGRLPYLGRHHGGHLGVWAHLVTLGIISMGDEVFLKATAPTYG